MSVDLNSAQLAFYQSFLGPSANGVPLSAETSALMIETFERMAKNGSYVDDTGHLHIALGSVELDSFTQPATFHANVFIDNVFSATTNASANVLAVISDASFGANTTLHQTLVNGLLTVNANATLGNTVVNGTLLANGATTVNGAFAVHANSTLGNTALGNTVINGTTTANGALSANGDTTITGNLAVSGTITGAVAGVTVVPIGGVVAYVGAASPNASWLLCDGTAYTKVAQATLYAVQGDTYGANTTHFNVPDLRQRFPMGKAASGTGAVLGVTGGSIDHTHTSNAHTHTVASHTHTIPALTVASHTHTTSDHQHTFNHGHTLSVGTDSQGSHSHAGATGGPSGSVSVDASAPNTTVPADGHTHSIGSDGSHTHTASGSTDIFAGSTGLAGAGNTGAASPATGASTSGGTSLTTDSTTPGPTGSNNPPFVTLNFIVRAA